MSEDTAQVHLAASPRIWLGASEPGPQTRLFRRTFDLDAPPRAAQLHLFAEATYHLWVNGQYLGRGPILHHPTYRPYDSYDLSAWLRRGRNVIAVLVHTPATALHNFVPAGEPGLVGQLVLQRNAGSVIRIDTDRQWRVTDRTGWQSDVPKRSWAIGYIEHFIAAEAPGDWQSTEFDDSTWSSADEHPATRMQGVQFPPRDLPGLRYAMRDAGKRTAFQAICEAPIPLNRQTGSAGLARALDEAEWPAPPQSLRIIDGSGGVFTVEGLTPDTGAVVCFDLGETVVGQVVLECDAQSGGIIDTAWSEVAMNGRPQLLRKGVSYVDRIETDGRPVRWEPIGFSSMRYLVVVLRRFAGSVTFRSLHVRTSEPDLHYRAQFTCDDDQLNRIWAMCERTVRIGTQEALMDCPSREQACYIGDGHPVAQWLLQLSGDARHWKYLVREQFRRTAPNGLVRSCVFTGRNDTLIDYTLLAVLGTRNYQRTTGDAATPAAVLQACHGVLGWFDARRDADGLFVSGWKKERGPGSWERQYDPSQPTVEDPDDLNLFIDHPGMGWHNVGEPGIDRRGTNAAINCLLVMARRALADLEETAGNPAAAASLHESADALARVIHERFFDRGRQYFIDGELDGQPLTQVSEQTNTWAIAARCCDDETARSILVRLLEQGEPDIARSGPYFWTYMLPELERLGLHEQAVEAIRHHWGRMLDGGATTLWETFAGDHLDTWCHPWSAPPLEFLLMGLLGLPAETRAGEHIKLCPKYDLLGEAQGRICTHHGVVSIRWRREDRRLVLSGELPQGVEASVMDPGGNRVGIVRGAWRIDVG